jgi:hypothetical protein
MKYRIKIENLAMELPKYDPAQTPNDHPIINETFYDLPVDPLRGLS